MKKGFTLIELIVSVGIFSVVMVIALGALLSVSAGERKAETLKSVMNNLNFSLESMTRTIRTGRNYTLESPLGERLRFNQVNDSSDSTYTYYQWLHGDAFASPCRQPLGSVSCLGRWHTGENIWIALTAPEVQIDHLNFDLVGTGANDNIQPKITITLSGTVQVSATQTTPFNLQTSVTQRLYDL